MINRIDFRLAVNTTLILLTGIVVFHLMVVAGIIPYSIVCGGKLKSTEEMLRFEFASLAINLFLVVVILIKAEYIRISISQRIITIILWLYFGLFSLNTIGNLLAEKSLETLIFTPLTFILAVLIYRIASLRQIQHKQI